MIGPIYAVPVQPGVQQENVPWAKPIRIFQKILVLIVFILTWTMIYSSEIKTDGDKPEILPASPCEGAAMATLYGAFFIILLVDMISQCARDPITDTPMFIFGIIGASCFTLAAIIVFSFSGREGVKGIWIFYVISIVNITCAILFVLDVLLVFLYGY